MASTSSWSATQISPSSMFRWRKLEDSLTHSIWNSENEKHIVVERKRNRYVKFLQNILNDKSPSSSDAEKKQGQANGNIPRTSGIPVRSVAATSLSNRSGTVSTGAKPHSQQVHNFAGPPSKPARTVLGLTINPATKAPTKPTTNGRS